MELEWRESEVDHPENKPNPGVNILQNNQSRAVKLRGGSSGAKFLCHKTFSQTEAVQQGG